MGWKIDLYKIGLGFFYICTRCTLQMSRTITLIKGIPALDFRALKRREIFLFFRWFHGFTFIIYKYVVTNITQKTIHNSGMFNIVVMCH